MKTGNKPTDAALRAAVKIANLPGWPSNEAIAELIDAEFSTERQELIKALNRLVRLHDGELMDATEAQQFWPRTRAALRNAGADEHGK